MTAARHAAATGRGVREAARGVTAPPVPTWTPTPSGSPFPPAPPRRGNGGGGRGGEPVGGEPSRHAVARVGLVLAMASMSMIFGAAMSAYIVRMGLGGWQSIRVAGMPLLWVNTFVLASASVALLRARNRARGDGARAALPAAIAASALGTAFLAGQALAWLALLRTGVTLAANPAGSFFYLVTALHGLHIAGGLVALAWVTARLGRRAAAPSAVGGADRAGAAVELAGLYWHFLLAVWLILFALMLVT